MSAEISLGTDLDMGSSTPTSGEVEVFDPDVEVFDDLGTTPSSGEIEPSGKAIRSNHRIPRELRYQLCRELAGREHSQYELARKYGVDQSSISTFAKRHAGRIDEIREHLDTEFAGLWAARKENRIAALQELYAQAQGHRAHDHHEWLKAAAAILRNIAEETGQLKGTHITGVVTHVLEGVETDSLR